MGRLIELAFARECVSVLRVEVVVVVVPPLPKVRIFHTESEIESQLKS